MPPKGNVFCSALCLSRSFAGFDRALFEESAAKRIEKRKTASKLAGKCDWCGAPSKNLYCHETCHRKRVHSDENECKSERARERREQRAEACCLDCPNPIGRIVYTGRLPLYCERCCKRRNAESNRTSRRQRAQPNLPLPRALRRVLDAAKSGVRTKTGFRLALTLGQRTLAEGLRALVKRGLLVTRKPPQGKLIYVPAEETLELDGALLEAARAEDAYREAWDRVLASRAALDQLLMGTPPVRALPPLSKHLEESLRTRCLQLLESAPEESFCLKSVALTLGCTRKEATTALCFLCRAGEIERAALGLYRARSKPQAKGAKAA